MGLGEINPRGTDMEAGRYEEGSDCVVRGV